MMQIFHFNHYKQFTTSSMKSSEEKIRLQAVKSFGEITRQGDLQAFHILNDLLSEEHELVAKEVINAMTKIGYPYRDKISEKIFSNHPWVWKNAITLIIIWEMKEEYKYLIQSAITNIFRIYENLQAFKILSKSSTYYTIDVLLQYLTLQNEVLIKGILKIITLNSKDLTVADSLYSEVRSIDPIVRDAAIELIDHLGDKKISKHLISYFTLENIDKRLSYAKKAWHVDQIDYRMVIISLLYDHDEWIRACASHAIGLIADPSYIKILTKVISSDESSSVKETATKALKKIKGELTMSDGQVIDFMEIVIFLKTTSLFNNFTLPQLIPIAKLLKQKRYSPNTILYESGEFIESFYFIFDGEVEISQKTNQGTYITLGTLKKGDIILEKSVFDGTSTHNRVRSMNELRVLILNKKDYLHLLELHPEISAGLIQALCIILNMYQHYIENK